MKTIFKRASKSTLAVVLSLCLLVSCLTVGIIATDAAKTDSEAVGGTEWENNGAQWANVYSNWTTSSNGTSTGCKPDSTWHDHGNMTWNSNQFEHTFVLKSNTSYQFKIMSCYFNNDGKWYGQASSSDWLGASASANCGIKKDGNNIPLVTMNADSGWVTVKIMAKPADMRIYVTQTAVEAETLKISGSMTGWKNYNDSSSVTMTKAGNGIYTYTFSSLAAKTGTDDDSHRYRFTILDSPDWNRASNEGVTYGSSTTVTTDTSATISTYGMLNVSGQCTKFQLSSACDVTITYDYVNNTLNIHGANSYDYYVTSAGATDSDNGFTNTPWDADDPGGGMESDTSVSGYTYSKEFTDLPIGTYRFKITDGSWTNSWGDNGSMDYSGTSTYIANTSRENNGNAKFDIVKAATVKIYFNPTNGNMKVTATAGTAATMYYIVGAASDGTRGMFANVWAENWSSYSSDDSVNVTSGTAGTYTKVYTDFRGTTGTYSYKAVKVDSDGATQYPESTNNTVNITSRTTQVTFSVTVDASGEITAVTATTTEGSASSDATYDPIFNNEQTNREWHLFTSTTDSGLELNDSAVVATVYKNNDYYFKIKVSELNGTSNEYIAVTNGNNTSSIIQGDTHKSVTVASRATDYLDAGGQGYTYGGQQRQFSRVKFKNSTAASSFNYIVLKFNNASYSYTYDVYGSASGSESITELTTVDIYAKNGTLRDDTFNRFTNLANTDVISITDPDGIVHTSSDWGAATGTWSSSAGTWETDKSGYGSSYEKITKVPIGSKVKLRTYLSNSTASGVQYYQSGKSFADTHYLKAYSFNGMTYQLHKASEATSVTSGYKFVSGDQYYEEEWTVEAINTTNMKNGNTVEITPIYYMKDNSNCKTFYIDGYIGDLQTKWGTMLCVYPYYEGKSDKANAFGGYPGQPMLYWGGKYQMEVPLTVDGTATGAQVKGLTMHNAYWDLLHRALDTKCDDGHCQTYDYDDFYKLYKEKNADTIYYWFKYRDTTMHDNYNDGYEYTTYDFVTSKSDTGIQVGTDSDANKKKTTLAKIEAANGAEIVTDYYHRQVDIFGTILPSASRTSYTTGTSSLTGNELLIVSDGYKDTYVGEYGTIWAVYTQDSTVGNFTFLGYISSSMLYLNSINSVNNYTGGTNTGSGKMSWSEFTSTYNTLKESYTGKPVLISYEREIWNNSKDKANRSDGKWYYSMGNDKINANIKIQYTSSTTATLMDESAGWVDDDFDDDVIGFGGEKNVGENTGCSAYFTNTSPTYLVGKTSASDILVNNEQHFTFQANSGGTYEFVGWVRECGGEKNAIASTNGLGQSNISANDTYIARFRAVASGKLVISHNIVQDSTHKGNGTKYLKVQVYDGSDNLKKEYIREDGTDIDVSDYIKSTNTSYKIKVTLSTVPDEDCIVDVRTCVPNDSKFTTAAFSPAAGQTLTQTKEFNVSDVFSGSASTVTAVRYYTYLTKTAMTYNYSITYHYTSRFWGDQTYTVDGTVSDERYASQYFEGTKSGARLTDEFIKNSTPYEKNFRQKINWNYTDSAVGSAAAMTKGCTSGGENIYNLTAEVWASNSVDDSVKAEFLLPYKYNADTSKGANDRDKSAVALPVYNSDGTVTSETAYAFDEDSYESFTVTSRVGRLFQWDGTIEDNPAQASDHADDYNLIEAAPYILYKSYTNGVHETVDFHYKKVSNKRYYTGNSFTVNGITYYKSVEDMGGQSQDATHVVLTSSNTVTVYKPEKAGQAGYDGTTYEFAVKDNSTNAVYFFAYAMNSDDQMVDNAGNVTETPVFNGQYIIYTENDVIDGIVKNSDGENFGYLKKYFTRWDIYNSSGELVASSYYRQFNYSGYENYTIKPIYAYDTPSAAAEASNGLTASISYLGDSRNQWKEPGTTVSNPPAGGTYNSTTGMNDATYAGDKIFTDFAIAYNYNDQQINKIASSTEQIKIGMVIEKLNPVQMVGDKAITDPSYYAGLSTYNAYNLTEMTNYVKGKVNSTSTSRPNSTVSNGVTHIAIGDNSNGFSSTSNLTGQTGSVLDNKNRMQYFYTFTKSKNDFENLSTNTGNVRPYDCVYRVTSYIAVGTGASQRVALSSPVYFTIYDIATR